MADSPFVPQHIAEYISRHGLEQSVEQCVNAVLETTPENPYNYFTSYFGNKAGSEMVIRNIKAYRLLSGEAMHLLFTVFYREQEYKIISDVQINQAEQEQIGEHIKLVNESLGQQLVGLDIGQNKKVDALLMEVPQPVAQQISFSMARVASKVLNQNGAQYLQQLYKGSQNSRYLFTHLFYGGKASGLKQKLYKVYLMSEHDQSAEQIQNVLQALKKNICSGKQGEAALKFHSDGSVLCPVDTIMDAIKLVEDAIQGLPGFKIGLSFQADSLWVDAAKKYELENPKTPFDTEQMIEYLVKLCTDKPCIAYLEDPLISAGPLEDWQKLKEKLPEGVLLGSRKVLEQTSTLEELVRVQSSLDTPTEPDFSSVLDYSVLPLGSFQTMTQLMGYVDLCLKLKTKTSLLLQEQNISGGYSFMADLHVLAGVEICVNPPFRASQQSVYQSLSEQYL